METGGSISVRPLNRAKVAQESVGTFAGGFLAPARVYADIGGFSRKPVVVLGRLQTTLTQTARGAS